MTPTPSPDPGRCPECGCGWWEPHRTGCSEPRFLTPDPAAAGEGTERPGGWRKKPVEVEARQVHYANRFDVAAWCGGEAQDAAPSGNVYAPGLLSINTLEGKMWASEGDWIIRGVKGEFYPCKPDIFAATYEPATPQPPVPPQGTERPDTDTLRKIGAGTDGDGITLLTRAERAFLARAADWIAAQPPASPVPPTRPGADAVIRALIAACPSYGRGEGDTFRIEESAVVRMAREFLAVAPPTPTPCPYIVTGGEGTSHCSLAERSAMHAATPPSTPAEPEPDAAPTDGEP